ncbi:hypothetical protein NUU61_000865 [Penicillium alfredii]|uniref:Integral membrane protein n=1 Tax=Penicillium alfredii TaxID=1506179 RepID=A0A9W9GAE3_9EURO|nr:uncharacterized protein NUU61_000865 [Penicillium alfredii]KAJ5115106.1 hypothetical protein NUU61_000865 [Penicillium alfredii]
MDPDASIPEPAPSAFNYVLSFLLVGVAWGFTTPFIRRAAADFNARQGQQQASSTASGRSRPQTDGLGEYREGEEQELLPPDESFHSHGVRRSTSSDSGRMGAGARTRRGQEQEQQQQDAEEEEEEEEEEDNTPTPAWKRSYPPTQSWLRTKIVGLFWTVVNLLRTPAYSIPLVINLTGSVWFFLLVGKHGMKSPKLSLFFGTEQFEDDKILSINADTWLMTPFLADAELSLTVPLANSSAFLFTVLGEWYVERKVIAKETWLGLVLVLGGIALCVHSKNQTD